MGNKVSLQKRSNNSKENNKLIINCTICVLCLSCKEDNYRSMRITTDISRSSTTGTQFRTRGKVYIPAEVIEIDTVVIRWYDQSQYFMYFKVD
jgi:hypothetical protein